MKCKSKLKYLWESSVNFLSYRTFQKISGMIWKLALILIISSFKITSVINLFQLNNDNMENYILRCLSLGIFIFQTQSTELGKLLFQKRISWAGASFLNINPTNSWPRILSAIVEPNFWVKVLLWDGCCHLASCLVFQYVGDEGKVQNDYRFCVHFFCVIRLSNEVWLSGYRTQWSTEPGKYRTYRTGLVR